ncbi:MAG: RHS repeat protein [Bacilli bacterium]|nr:RHS repeat protein [Bacilli bacterium]
MQSVIDPKGNTTHYNYDAIGRLIEVVKGNASATYIYEQNLLKEIQVNGYTIRLNYDQYNRISSINIGNFRLAQYRYETELDQYGNLIETNKLKEQIYGNGDKIKFEYDDEDRIKAVFVNSSTIPRYEYEYDSLGNIAVYIDHWNSKTYFYNYDLVGRLITITDEQNNSISYEYDKDLGHLNLLTYNLNHIIRSIHYDYNLDTGQYDQTSYNVNGTNVIKDYTYDSLGRLEQTIPIMGQPKSIEQFMNSLVAQKSKMVILQHGLKRLLSMVEVMNLPMTKMEILHGLMTANVVLFNINMTCSTN